MWPVCHTHIEWLSSLGRNVNSVCILFVCGNALTMHTFTPGTVTKTHHQSLSLLHTHTLQRAVIVSFNSHENVSFFVLAKLVQKGSKYLIEEGKKLDSGFTTVFYKFTIRFLHRTWHWFWMDSWVQKYFKFLVLETERTVYTLCTIKWSNRLHPISMPKSTCMCIFYSLFQRTSL